MSARSQYAAPRVLLADDDGDVLEALQLLLKAHGFRSQAVNSAAAALAALREGEYEALLADMKIAEAHGGSLTLANRPARAGCRATVTLPDV